MVFGLLGLVIITGILVITALVLVTVATELLKDLDPEVEDFINEGSFGGSKEPKGCTYCPGMIIAPDADKCPRCHNPFLHDFDGDFKSDFFDPLMVGEWSFEENDTARCEPANGASFDYDNDGHPEWFCYNMRGDVVSVDFDRDGEMKHGYEILNFYRTIHDGMTAFEYLHVYKDTCDVYDCYLWNDANRDLISQPWELESYDIEITEFIQYSVPEGEKCHYHTNERCIFGEGKTSDGRDIYAVAPSYHMNIGNHSIMVQNQL